MISHDVPRCSHVIHPDQRPTSSALSATRCYKSLCHRNPSYMILCVPSCNILQCHTTPKHPQTFPLTRPLDTRRGMASPIYPNIPAMEGLPCPALALLWPDILRENVLSINRLLPRLPDLCERYLKNQLQTASNCILHHPTTSYKIILDHEKPNSVAIIRGVGSECFSDVSADAVNLLDAS